MVLVFTLAITAADLSHSRANVASQRFALNAKPKLNIGYRMWETPLLFAFACSNH
ncbi:hypothetical protein PanWU01x14_145530, partial [Parasponia andersonii]